METTILHFSGWAWTESMPFSYGHNILVCPKQTGLYLLCCVIISGTPFLKKNCPRLNSKFYGHPTKRAVSEKGWAWETNQGQVYVEMSIGWLFEATSHTWITDWAKHSRHFKQRSLSPTKQFPPPSDVELRGKANNRSFSFWFQECLGPSRAYSIWGVLLNGNNATDSFFNKFSYRITTSEWIQMLKRNCHKQRTESGDCTCALNKYFAKDWKWQPLRSLKPNLRCVHCPSPRQDS